MKYRLIPVLLAGAVAFLSAVSFAAREREHTRPWRERVRVEQVLATEDGDFILLLRTEEKPVLFLPIVVGEVEALGLKMRLDHLRPPRPLTLNLLESVLEASDIEVTEVSIGSSGGHVVTGRIRLAHDGHSWELDSRPSDAVGLAMGRGLPVWASRELLDQAGIDPRTLEPKRGEQVPSSHEGTL